jgi:Protein of unknown function (DUF4238)
MRAHFSVYSRSVLAHYLPRMYLKRFVRSDDGRVAVYDLVTNKIRRDKPKNVAVITDFYIVTDAAGQPDERIEREFLGGIETEASPIIDALCAGRELSSHERDVLAFFMALLAARVPSFAQTHTTLNESLARVTFQRLAGTPDRAREFLQGRRRSLPFSPEELSRYVNSPAFAIAPDQNSRIHMMLEIASSIAEALRSMRWRVLRSIGARFITGDGPTGFIPEPGAAPTYGEQSPHVRKFISFSPAVCLCIENPAARDAPIASEFIADSDVERINDAIALAATRLLIGQEEADIQSKLDRIRSFEGTPRIGFVEWYDSIGHHSVAVSVRVHRETVFPLRLVLPWLCRACTHIGIAVLFVGSDLTAIMPSQFTDWLDTPCMSCGASPRETNSSLTGKKPVRLVPPQDE